MDSIKYCLYVLSLCAVVLELFNRLYSLLLFILTPTHQSSELPPTSQILLVHWALTVVSPSLSVVGGIKLFKLSYDYQTLLCLDVLRQWDTTKSGCSGVSEAKLWCHHQKKRCVATTAFAG